MLLCTSVTCTYFLFSRIFRLSGPRLNAVVAIGCLLGYMSVLLDGLNGQFFALQLWSCYVSNMVYCSSYFMMEFYCNGIISYRSRCFCMLLRSVVCLVLYWFRCGVYLLVSSKMMSNKIELSVDLLRLQLI